MSVRATDLNVLLALREELRDADLRKRLPADAVDVVKRLSADAERAAWTAAGETVLSRVLANYEANLEVVASGPQCCRRCGEFHGSLGSMMFACSDCGNKRCPKGTYHGNDCTGSNEPGQPGSDYQ